MADRPTVEFVLPVSQVKLVLFSYLTIRESTQLKKIVFDAVQMTLPTTQGEKPVIDKMNASFDLATKEFTFRTLLKTAFTPEGIEIPDSFEYVQNLPAADAAELYAKVEEISAQSVMTKDAKKN